MPRLVQNDEPAIDVEPTVLPEWREVTVVFQPRSDDAAHPRLTVIGLDGWQYGTLAIHATWTDPDAPAVTITHRPSKLVVARLDDADQAAEEVERLWQRCPRAWAGDEVDESIVPPDVLQWCRGHR